MKTLLAILFLAALAAVAACGGSSPAVCSLNGGAPLASTDWPKFRGDISNTGQSSADLSTFPATGEMRLHWSHTTGGAVSASPSIGPDGEIYIGSADSRMYRLNRVDGTVDWQQTTNNTITTGPALDTLGNLFVTSNDGNLYTLSTTNGGIATRNAVTVVGSLSSPNLAPAPNTGVVYFGSLTTGLFASCPNSILRWAQQIVPVIATPAIDALGNVIAVSANVARTLVSVNPTSGQANWTFTATAPINASPMIGSDGTIYIVDASGRLFGVNPTTGVSISSGALFDLTQSNPGAEVFASPALRTNVLDTIYIPDTTGTLWAVTVDTTANPPSAQVRWQTKVANAGIFSSPVVSTDGTLIFGADDGTVYAVQDAGDAGTLRWTYTTEGPVRSSPAILQDATDTVIYVGSNDRRVYALRPPE